MRLYIFFLLFIKGHEYKKKGIYFDLLGENYLCLTCLLPCINNNFMSMGFIDKIKFENTILPEDKIKEIFNDYLQSFKLCNFFIMEIISLFIEINDIHVKNTRVIYKIKDHMVDLKFTSDAQHTYFIDKIVVYNHQIMKEHEIIHVIKDYIIKLNFLEKIKLLLFGTSHAIFFWNVYEDQIHEKIEELGKKHLLLNVSCKIFYLINQEKNTVKIIININEGSKYFIDNIYIDKIKINDETLKNNIIKEINTHGMKDDFNYLKYLFSKSIKITYIIQNNLINIYIDHVKEELDIIRITNIIFVNLNISNTFLISLMNFSVGDSLNVEKIEEFTKLVSELLNKHIEYEIVPVFNDRGVIVKFFTKAAEKEINILNIDNNEMMLEYKYEKIFYNYPYIRYILTPRINLNRRIPGVLMEFYFQKFYPISISSYFQLYFNFNKNMNIRSFIIDVINLNYKTKNFIFSFTPIGLKKYFNTFATDRYIYRFTSCEISRIFSFTNHSFALSNNYKYFYDNNKHKLSVNFEYLYQLHYRYYLWINNNLSYSQGKNINHHFSSIYYRDNCNVRLYTYPHEHMLYSSNLNLQQYDYIFNKQIALWTPIYVLKINLLYKLFSFKLDALKSLNGFFCIFLDIYFDVTTKTYKFSYGIGFILNYYIVIMGIYLGFNSEQKGLRQTINLEKSLLLQ